MAGGILSGLGQVLQYALPAAAGFALGGPLGGLAGAGIEAQANEQQRTQQAELQDKQAETALRWQQFGLEKQQAETAMQTEKSWKDYTDTLPQEDRALAQKDPTSFINQRLANKQWDLTRDTLKNHPEFAQSMGLDPKAVNAITALPAGIGQPLLDKYTIARQHGDIEQQKLALQQAYDTSRLGIEQEKVDIERGNAGRGPKPKLVTLYGPNGQEKEVAAGEGFTPPDGWSLTKPTSASSQKAKALTLLNTYKSLNNIPNLASYRPEAAKAWRDGAIQALTSSGVPDDIAKSTVDAVLPSPSTMKPKSAKGATSASAASAKKPLGRVIGDTSKPDGSYNLKGRHIQVVGGKAYDVGAI